MLRGFYIIFKENLAGVLVKIAHYRVFAVFIDKPRVYLRLESFGLGYFVLVVNYTDFALFADLAGIERRVLAVGCRYALAVAVIDGFFDFVGV